MYHCSAHRPDIHQVGRICRISVSKGVQMHSIVLVRIKGPVFLRRIKGRGDGGGGSPDRDEQGNVSKGWCF